MITYAAAAVLVPLVTFAALAVIWPLRHTGRLAGLLSCATALFSLGCAVRAWAGLDGGAELFTLPWLVHDGRVIAEVGVRLDGVSAPMLIVVTLVAAAVQIYSLGYMADEPDKDFGRYFTWHSLFIFAMGGLVVAPNLLQLLVSWELVGLCSYLLIGYFWAKPSAGRAAVKAVWITRLADIGLMSGVVLLYAETGGFSYEAAIPGAGLVAGLLFIGVMGKSAQVPLHVWLPDAMEGPTPVSALLHAATMVAAGVFLIVRCWPLFEAAPDVLAIMGWVGGITAFVAACTAVVQTDIKKVLAYSTCSQLGYMVAGLSSGSMLGGYFHLTTHAFFKALLFLGAGSVIHAVHSNELADMGGLSKKLRVTTVLFVTGSLALAGFPALAGFFSKDLILEELAHAGSWGPLALLLAAAALTAFYMTRVVVLAFFGAPGHHTEHAHESPLVMLAPMAVLAALAVVAGWFGGDFAALVGEEYAFHVTPVGALATALALGGIGVGVAKYGYGQMSGLGSQAAVDFIRSGPIDGLFTGAWRQGLLPFARAMGWVDRYVVDGVMNLIGAEALTAGERGRALQTGQIRHYLYAVAVGVLGFTVWGALGG